jgi:CheY-like chemotaxis protein
MAKSLILVIDDDRFLLDGIQEILEFEDYQVITANGGAEGIRLAQQHRPSLIICDLLMPKVDGYQVVAALHDHPSTRAIPIILMASKHKPFDRRLDDSSFLTKPFSAEDLLLVVQTRLQHQEYLRSEVIELDFYDEDAAIRFLASYPEFLAPGSDYALLGYVFTETVQQQVLHDAYDHIAAEEAIYSGEAAIHENSVTAVPRIPGFMIEPERITREFHRAWHRFEFTIFAPYRPQTGFGSIDFYVNGIIAASISMTIEVREEDSEEKRHYVVAEPYQRIYCSYSHDDTRIAEHIDAVTHMPGHEFLRDVHTLRRGQDFSEENLHLIEQADAFQLFWSKHAAESEYMAKEWHHALMLNEKPPTFIRPVYWDDPFDAAIPPELQPVHFSFLPLEAPRPQSLSGGQRASGEKVPASSLLGSQILVVDDEIGTLTLIGIMLDRGGYEPVKAKSGEAALDMLDVISPVLIIVDSLMPDMDGPTLISRIRKRAETKETPILLLSPRGDASAVIKGIDSGANDYLPKPVLHHDLVGKVRQML